MLDRFSYRVGLKSLEESLTDKLCSVLLVLVISLCTEYSEYSAFTAFFVCWLSPGGLIGAVVTSARLRCFRKKRVHTEQVPASCMVSETKSPFEVWWADEKTPACAALSCFRSFVVKLYVGLKPCTGSSLFMFITSLMLWDHGLMGGIDCSIIDDLWRWPLRWNSMLSVEANLACRDLRWNQWNVNLLSYDFVTKM